MSFSKKPNFRAPNRSLRVNRFIPRNTLERDACIRRMVNREGKPLSEVAVLFGLTERSVNAIAGIGRNLIPQSGKGKMEKMTPTQRHDSKSRPHAKKLTHEEIARIREEWANSPLSGEVLARKLGISVPRLLNLVGVLLRKNRPFD